MISEVKPNSKKSIWSGLFSLMDKVHLKKTLTRGFIFHPPKPSYDFASKKIVDDFTCYEFLPKNDKKLKANQELNIGGFKIFMERKSRLYLTPLLYVSHNNHGNSSDLGTAYASAITLAKTLEMNVVVYDYTGYGISPNKPSEKNTYYDIEAIISFIVYHLKYPLNRVILCGFSLGSGPTVEMALQYKQIPLVILFAPLASCMYMLENTEKQISHSHDIFPNVDKVKRVSQDIILIHGTSDKTIPFKHSQMLIDQYEKTHDLKMNQACLIRVNDADHNDLIAYFDNGESEYKEVFLNYFKTLLKKAKDRLENNQSDTSSSVENEKLKQIFESIRINKPSSKWKNFQSVAPPEENTHTYHKLMV